MIDATALRPEYHVRSLSRWHLAARESDDRERRVSSAIGTAAALVACQNVDARQRFSHRLLLPLDVDVRDRYDAGSQATGDSDRVYIPDREGVAYRVVFVERRLRGTTLDHLRVYLSRVGTSASVEA